MVIYDRRYADDGQAVVIARGRTEFGTVDLTPILVGGGAVHQDLPREHVASQPILSRARTGLGYLARVGGFRWPTGSITIVVGNVKGSRQVTAFLAAWNMAGALALLIDMVVT
jgi:hypothetical protein